MRQGTPGDRDYDDCYGDVPYNASDNALYRSLYRTLADEKAKRNPNPRMRRFGTWLRNQWLKFWNGLVHIWLLARNWQ